MIRQLKSMKACHDDPRTLRNNLSDVQAIITTIQKQGEVIDSTYMTTMVIETFPKSIQEEIAEKNLTSGTEWTMNDLIDNLTNIVKRKEHLESRNEHLREQHSLFHTRTSEPLQLQCIGCGRPHKFDTCYKFQTIQQKINHLKTLNVCWKCFNTQHRTIFCNKPNCTHCGGLHNPIICLRLPSATTRSFRYPAGIHKHFGHRSTTLNDYATQHPPKLYRPQRNSAWRPLTPDDALSNTNIQQLDRSNQPAITHAPRNSNSIRRQNQRSPMNKVRYAPLPYIPTATHISFQSHSGHQPEMKTRFSNCNKTNIHARLMVVPLIARNDHTNKEEQVYALSRFRFGSIIYYIIISRTPTPRASLRKHHHCKHIRGTCREKTCQVCRNLVAQLSWTILTYTITNVLTIIELQPEDKHFLEENFSTPPEVIQDSRTEVVPDILLGIDYFNTILLGSYGQPNMDYSDLWKLPGIGIDELQTNEELNKQIIANFYSTVQLKNGKIYIQFPWKSNKHCLADNYNLALSRLHQLCKMRIKNPECWEEYCNIIQEQKTNTLSKKHLM
ncbi:hypothetical protein OSTOST_01942 [Ostertagia ostertagi]